MQSQSARIQITFHYVNGETESFSVSDPLEAETVRQDIQQELRRTLEKHWWVFQLGEQTVIINTENVLKVEIQPPALNFQGEGVFYNAQRVTSLRRAHIS